jgi:hypothetical protein
MSNYTVAIKGEGEATARSTEDLDEALDWFTNSVTLVMDPAEEDDDVTHATLQVDGITVAIVAIGGIGPTGEAMTGGPKLRRVA